ncbi:MAG: serine/threonine-protein kinase [Pseudomonadota bacterium]
MICRVYHCGASSGLVQRWPLNLRFMASLTATSASTALDDACQATAPLDDEVCADRPQSAYQPGDLLARRYQVNRLLERGGMADVYAATDVELRRPVALKIASDEPLQADVASERLLREARIIACLQHPNIAAVHDHGRTSQGTAFLVLELIEGRTLRHLLTQRGKLPWRTAVAIALQIAAGLRAVHARGVVHCDLSPSNVLLARKQQGGLCCKLIDFGIACHESEARIAPFHGTRRFVAPEVFKGASADARLDLYALGVILADMLADEPDTPVALALLTRTLRAADPQARPPNAAAVIEALQRIAIDVDRTVAASPAQTEPQRHRLPASSRMVWRVTGIAALLAAGALIAAVHVEQAPTRAVAAVPSAPPPPTRAELQEVPLRIQPTMPELSLPGVQERTLAVVARAARPATVARPLARRELEAALLERREQLSRAGTGSVDVVAVDKISFDPSRRSARVVYRRRDSTAGVVEYWAVRDGHWQSVGD